MRMIVRLAVVVGLPTLAGIGFGLASPLREAEACSCDPTVQLRLIRTERVEANDPAWWAEEVYAVPDGDVITFDSQNRSSESGIRTLIIARSIGTGIE